MTEKNKEIVLRFWEEAFNEGRLEVVDDLFAPECTHRDPFVPDGTRGAESTKEVVAAYRAGFPDASVSIRNMIAEENWVTVLLSASGTHEGFF